MLTPFDAKGAVDVAAIGPMVDQVLSQGIDGLYVGGSTGECVLMSTEQRIVLLKALAEYAKGECSIVAHVGSAATGDAARLAEVAAEAGYDAVSAVPPYYYKFSPDDILAYYDTIASASALPLIVYHIPTLSSVNLSLAHLEKLLADDRVAGIKFTDSDLFKFERLMTFAPQKLHYFGSDEMFLGASAMGAYGGIGSTYQRHRRTLRCHAPCGRQRRHGHGSRLFRSRSIPSSRFLLEVGVIPGLKHAMNRLGNNVGTCLPPFRALDPAPVARLEAWLDAYEAPNVA